MNIQIDIVDDSVDTLVVMALKQSVEEVMYNKQPIKAHKETLLDREERKYSKKYIAACEIVIRHFGGNLKTSSKQRTRK